MTLVHAASTEKCIFRGRYAGGMGLSHAAITEKCIFQRYECEIDGICTCSQHRDMHVSEVGRRDRWDFHAGSTQKCMHTMHVIIR